MYSFDLANSDFKTQIFYESGVWQKPPGISGIHIFCLGAGGGGGGGFSNATGSNRGGGGGGAAGGVWSGVITSFGLPDMLYVTVGEGGAGGSAGINGFSGGTSLVEASPSGSKSSNFVVGIANGGGGGVAGNNTSVRAAGGTSSVPATTSYKLAFLGVSSALAGQSGAQGGDRNLSPGDNIPYASTNSLQTSGGAGGGGGGSTTIQSGGSITDTTGFLPFIPGGVIQGGNGVQGIFRLTPNGFVSQGGSGGGGASGISGGNGGNGNIGSGGGGGGGGLTGGTGGNGGNGLVIIVSY